MDRTAYVPLLALISLISSSIYPQQVFAADPTPNPPLTQACGLDIALVIDSSDSVSNGSGGKPNELGQMKSAFHYFIDSLIPSTSAQLSVVEFDQVVHVTPFTTSTTTPKFAIDAAVQGGGTNWQQALLAAQGTFDPRVPVPNLIIVASDGNPTYVGAPPSATSSTVALNAAIDVANTIKNSGTRIITIGIGNATGLDALNIDNLKAISGPNVDTGDLTSDVITTNFGLIASDMAKLALELCGTLPPLGGGGGGGGGNGPPVGLLGTSGSVLGASSDVDGLGGGATLDYGVGGGFVPEAEFLPGVPDTGQGGDTDLNLFVLFVAGSTLLYLGGRYISLRMRREARQ